MENTDRLIDAANTLVAISTDLMRSVVTDNKLSINDTSIVADAAAKIISAASVLISVAERVADSE